MRWLFPVTGLLSLTWFLIRVIPKPSRVRYPCQRVALPLAWSFVAWLLTAVGSVAAFKKAKTTFTRKRYLTAFACALLSLLAVWLLVGRSGDKLVLAESQPANEPMGVGQGIHPGRVVWVHDPDATDWAGPGDGHGQAPAFRMQE